MEVCVRVIQEIESNGCFWLPDDPERQLSGTLKVSDSGSVLLEVMGHFGELDFNKTPKLDRVLGYIEVGGDVTLENCTCLNLKTGGISKSIFQVSLALIGACYEKDDITFSKVSFSVEGFNQWMGGSGISGTRNYEDKSILIKYEPLPKVEFTLHNNVKFTFDYSSDFQQNLNEVRLTERPCILLESDDSKPYEFFLSLIFQITNFFCFAIDRTITLELVTGFSSKFQIDLGDESFDKPIRLYYKSRPFSEENLEIHSHNMLFRYDHFRDNIGVVLTKWLANYERFKPVFNLYFASKFGENYLEAKFLFLAQGIETLHRYENKNETYIDESKYGELKECLMIACPEEHKDWLKGKLEHGNELSLRKRIKQMITPFNTFFGNNQKRLIQKIIDTRNYLTHYSERLEQSKVDKGELWKVCMKLEHLFQLHLLRLIGMTDGQIEDLISKNERFLLDMKDDPV